MGTSGYQPATAQPPDVIAGLAVGGLVIPKALGDAGIAQVPAHSGLYAAAAGTIPYARRSACLRQTSTGAERGAATVAGGAVLAVGATGQGRGDDGSFYITFVSGIRSS